MNDRLLKRLILKEIHSALNEGRGELDDREAIRFSDLVNSAADKLDEAFSILDNNGIIGTLTDRVSRVNEELNGLAGEVSSKFGSGFNPYASAEARKDPYRSTRDYEEEDEEDEYAGLWPGEAEKLYLQKQAAKKRVGKKRV